MSEINNLSSVKKQGRGKKTLLMLAAIFLLPFSIAAVLHLLDIRPGGKSFGHLITPPVSLTIPVLDSVLQDRRFSSNDWSKIWNIVMIDEYSCAESCRNNIDKIDRVYRTLPKEADRIQRILLLTGTIDLAGVKELQDQFPQLVILSASNEQQFINDFKDAAPIGSVYLVDPLNNLMMDYSEDLQPKALRSDLVRLLKNSWSG
ncbi:MAG: hypothetical protein KFB94_03175 [Methylophilaceae bacterium]|jgi:hypothetical protein|nr:MAG: hypothetical protein KFB94_03175 [Methylophilaceae bacterium]